MLFSIARDLKNELFLADKLYNKTISSWFSNIDSAWFNCKDDFTFEHIAAMSIVAYKLCGFKEEKVMQMTNLFKVVYVNNNLHGKIMDSHEGQIYNQEMKLKILIGDQISGKILKLILEAEADQLLSHFSRMMEIINEGLVLEYKTQCTLEEVLKRTKASLYATIFYSAAKLAGRNEQQISLFEDLGFNLGMAAELSARGRLEARLYVAKANRVLNRLALKPVKEYKIIVNLIRELRDASQPKAAAVI